MTIAPLASIGSRLLSLSKESWLYIFGHGFLFAAEGVAYDAMRITVSILLSLSGEPFDIELESGRVRGNAFVVRPGVWRCVGAADTPLVSIGLCPTHERFRAFSMLPGPGDVWALPRELYDDCHDELQLARAGRLSPVDAHAVGRVIMSRTQALFPRPPELDPRIQRVCERVDAQPGTAMTALAEEVDLSYHHLSHLFSQEMGITLRMYAISRKLDLAAMMAGRGMNLTQIAISSGFADSAHFCRTWMRSIGGPPSQLLSSQKVGIRTAYGD